MAEKFTVHSSDLSIDKPMTMLNKMEGDRRVKQVIFFPYDRVEIHFESGMILTVRETQQAGDIAVEFQP